MEQFPNIVLVGIILVVGTSQFNRRVGSILGMGVWVTIAVVGHFYYAQGGVIGFPGLPLNEGLFLLLCAVFFGIQVLGLRNAQARSRRREELHRARFDSQDP